MVYIKQNESISIVVVGEFNPIYIHAKWMYDFGIITESEKAGIIEKSITIRNDVSRFYVNNLFEFTCLPNRIQVITHDITLSTRIIKLIKDILIINASDKIFAIGINADMDFTFLSVDDGYKFGKYFAKLDVLGKYLNEPRVLRMSFTDMVPFLENACLDNPKRTIEIKSIGQNNNIPIVQIMCNNHFNVTRIEEANKILDKADDCYTYFRETYEQLISEVSEKS